MELRSLECFLVLKKYEHMAIAADFLEISQSALSKSLRALETELGVKLFDRVGRRIKLNKNGENFARYVEQSMQLLQTGTLTTKSMCYEISGSVTIDCYAYAPSIIPCVNAYSELNPYTIFTVIQGENTNRGENGETTDFLLRSSLERGENLKKDHYWVAQELFSEEYLIIASSENKSADWEKYAETKDFSLLKECSFITMIQNDVFFNDYTFELCQNAGFVPQVYAKTDDFVVKVKIVENRNAIALIPRSCLEDALKLAPSLKAYSCPEGAERHLYLFHPKEAMMTETAKDFYEFVLDYFNAE